MNAHLLKLQPPHKLETQWEPVANVDRHFPLCRGY